MAQLRINANPTFTVDVTVRESDKYSRSVMIKFDRHVIPEEIQGCSEIYLTPAQVDQLGRFLIRQADEIKAEQAHREVA